MIPGDCIHTMPYGTYCVECGFLVAGWTHFIGVLLSQPKLCSVHDLNLGLGKKDNLLDYDMQTLQILSSLMLKIGFHTKWRLWTWPKYKEIGVFLYLLSYSLGWLAYTLPSKVTITKRNKTKNQINRIVNLFLFLKS